jgi:hypothetical protein
VTGGNSSKRRGASSTGGAFTTPLKIFLNYRRADTGGYAWALYLRLEPHFGHDNVFFDSANLRAGTKWFDEIKAHASAPGVFLALIGETWESSVLQRMRSGTEDVVVKELSRALRSGPRVTVIPVLVNEAIVPSAGPLPVSLKTLSGLQIASLRHTQLRDDMDRLIDRLDEIRDAAVPQVEQEVS